MTIYTNRQAKQVLITKAELTRLKNERAQFVRRAIEDKKLNVRLESN